MPQSGSKWGLDPNWTEPDPRSGLVQGPVQKNHNFWVGLVWGSPWARPAANPVWTKPDLEPKDQISQI